MEDKKGMGRKKKEGKEKDEKRRKGMIVKGKGREGKGRGGKGERGEVRASRKGREGMKEVEGVKEKIRQHWSGLKRRQQRPVRAA